MTTQARVSNGHNPAWPAKQLAPVRITQRCWWQGVDSLNSKQAGDFSSPWTQRRNLIAAEHTGARLLHLHLASAEDTHARTHTTGKDMHAADLRPGNYTHPKSIEGETEPPIQGSFTAPSSEMANFKRGEVLNRALLE